MTPHPKDPQNEKDARGSIYPPMNRALVASLVFHVIIILLMIFGLPYIRPHRDIPEVISVELATIADITQTNKPPVEAPKPPEPKEEKPEPARPTPPPPKAEPEPAKEQPEEAKKETPPPDDLAAPKKEEKKKEKPKKEEPKKDKSEQLNSLLKNLIKEEPKPKTDITDLTKKLTSSAPSPSPAAPVGQTLTISDMDALRQQLAGCWNVFAGASEAEDLAVDIRVIVTPTRTVQSASIIDQSRYNNDDRFRAAADSALRAVQNPKCSPLNLPPEKYDLWHDMIINFDPKDML